MAIEPVLQVAALVSPTPVFDSTEQASTQPEPLAAKLHEIGRYTLFQVFLS